MEQMQRNFMYLFERVGEPLYFGPRGIGNTGVVYNVDNSSLCDESRRASEEIRRNTAQGVRNTIQVKRLTESQLPQEALRSIGSVCPRTGIFSYFLPSHRRAAHQLRDILNRQSSMEDLLAMACACRDSSAVNPHLWVYAMSGCLLARQEMRNFRMPPFYEIMPDQFFSDHVTQQARLMARVPASTRMIITLDRNTTGRDNNPENRLSYFREDIGVNSHHWHWHVVYPTEDIPGPSSRDRRGELFYYMHHQMIARYEAERLSNGLSRVIPFHLDDAIKEGYFAKLYDTNSGRHWGTRQENTKISDIDRMESDGITTFRVKIEQVKMWRDRVLEAIDTNSILRRNANGQETRERLDPFTGIDVLGDMVEASLTRSPHARFYGDLHNMGHVLIAFSHDPRRKHQENIGPMGDTATAMRDPVFYRWHKYIDMVFNQWKVGLQPYPDKRSATSGATDFPLEWTGVEVRDVSVQGVEEGRQRNILTTFWTQSDVDLARGLDFGRTNANQLGSIWARFTHLNHENFTYHITVNNNTGTAALATVRLFIAPRFDENRERFSMEDQRLLFMEMDKFTVTLNPGANNVTRRSTESSVTIPWEQSFGQLESEVLRQPDSQENTPRTLGICGCGWPSHLLLPKGTPQGMIFDLVAFVTNGREDQVQSNVQGERANCREAMSYCGRLNDRYPDSKPMGYPFDRNPFLVTTPGNTHQRFAENLDIYSGRISNMSTKQVSIVHMDRTLARSGGTQAPTTMNMINEDGMCMLATGNTASPSAPVPSTQVTTTTSGPRPVPTTTTRPNQQNPGKVPQGQPPNAPGWGYPVNPNPGYGKPLGKWPAPAAPKWPAGGNWNRQGRNDSPGDDWDYMEDEDGNNGSDNGSAYYPSYDNNPDYHY